ncbi:divergent AAA domain protein [Phascolarctobacterium succinatutens CAG:287]|uniref:Divergent AAA domain protein n=1 Tax=Phascolarctobacterium succinatutens CAG:287 TaxID=1263101 RepID=R6XWS6_9FIRM|nr:RNA-binding domain-containing protein [Phascolarctobacterium succinatutens]CDD10722.1 divergent AAA domain protein [Phascolarctobacterium succinatutens CAG:287]
MLDFFNIEKYKENNRLEAKAAAVGLPKSLWATYSAFANTNGGIILLGVTEDAQHQLHVEGVNDADTLVIDFWNIINNQSKISINVLNDKDVIVREFDGKKIIIISVPRAQRYDKPIYLDGNLFSSYKRNGEGDYRCTKEVIQAMLRDASPKTQDMLVLGNMNLDVFDKDTIKRYRIRMQGIRPGHVWEALEDVDFLYRIGAVGRDADGKLHPTAAGLLMFGYEYEIVREYPHYFLDYREKLDDDTRWSDRFVSSSGDWSGNIYDFYFRVYNRIAQSVKVPFALDGISRIDDTELHKALREALANTLINADYYGNTGVVIERNITSITMTNAGTFRIDLDEAINGGISDPRNSGLIKMFSLINIGERAGSGLPMIFKAWTGTDFAMPDITEKENPDRVCLILPVDSLGEVGLTSAQCPNKNANEGSDVLINESTVPDTKETVPDIEQTVPDTKQAVPDTEQAVPDTEQTVPDSEQTVPEESKEQKALILSYIKHNEIITAKIAATILNVKPRRARTILRDMQIEGIIKRVGAARSIKYVLQTEK